LLLRSFYFQPISSYPVGGRGKGRGEFYIFKLDFFMSLRFSQTFAEVAILLFVTRKEGKWKKTE
jgi:hypothetical protein